MNCCDSIGPNNKLRNRCKAVGSDVIASDNIVALEEDGFKRLGAARRLHDHVGGFEEIVFRHALARELAFAPNNAAELFLQDHFRGMPLRAEFVGPRRPPAGRRRQARALTGPAVTTAQYLCQSGEITEGEARAFPSRPGSRAKLILVRRDGALYAYWDACPHYGDTPMAWRTDEYLNTNRDRIVCASHGAEFEIETGRCVLGAALGKSLIAAPIEVSETGEVCLAA